MKLTIDIGNTAVSFMFKTNDATIEAVSENLNQKSKQDYQTFLTTFLETKNTDLSSIKKIVLCSVVDSIKNILLEIFEEQTKAEIKILDYSQSGDLKLLVDSPEKLGNDMIASAMGAISLFKDDLCIVDCGTATTISLISKDKHFLSYNIMPGVNVQFNSLAANTFQLPKIKPKFSRDLFGTNTKDAILSGVIRGHSYSVCYFIMDLKTLFPNLKIIVTGGLSSYVRNYFDFEYEYIPSLIHIGLDTL